MKAASVWVSGCVANICGCIHVFVYCMLQQCYDFRIVSYHMRFVSDVVNLLYTQGTLRKREHWEAGEWSGGGIQRAEEANEARGRQPETERNLKK